ncbi:MAG TPA: TadE/TadG family type IV pilus assembly protein [Acidimicrobiia bacterium]|nr:TadE/TadG family type IV pilus assembly protein [Acidimicrobiia bacterium]
MSTRPDSERGAALVEFALVLPLIMALILGMVTGGAAYNRKLSLTNAVREGSRFGATLDGSSTWASSIQTRTAELATGDLSTSQVCVQLVKNGSVVVQGGVTFEALGTGCSSIAAPTVTGLHRLCGQGLGGPGEPGQAPGHVLQQQPDPVVEVHRPLRGQRGQPMQRLSLRCRLEDERGMTLVLMMLLLVALLGSAGLVVDLGLLRADRQRNKTVADVAVMAGLGAGDIGNGQVSTQMEACSAKTYLQANHPEAATFATTSWTNGNNAAIADPCSAPAAVACVNRTSFTWFHGVTSDGLIVDIKAGYDTSDMTSSGFRDEAFHSDYSAAGQNGCDQLAVIITESEHRGLSRVFGASQMSTSIRTVGRAQIQTESEDAVALLLLERVDCKALDINGTTTFVRVKGTGTRPGIIHADSVGSGSCTGSSRVIMGDHAEGVYAEQAPSGTPPTAGIVSLAALGGSNPSKAYDSTANVVAEGSSPISGSTKGRGPVDVRYLGLATGSTSAYGITKLKTDANAVFAITNNTQAAAAGYSYFTGNGNCPPNPAQIGTATRIFLNCNVTANWTVPTTVTDVAIKGYVDLNGATVTIPNPRTLYIYGAPGSNAKGINLGSGGNLVVNSNNITSAPSGSTICEARRTADPTATTRLVVGNGQINGGSTGTLRMCATTVFMMDGSLPTTTGTVPSNNSYNGPVSVTGQSTLEWTAPNQNNVGQPTDAELREFEDLALWTETSDGISIGGTNASIILKGILFTPNANPFKMNSGAGGITADAQFITRKLEVSGGATLSMKADPNNSVPFSFISGFSLVR